MKLLIICAVLGVCVAVSLASPVAKIVRHENDSSVSAESGELKISENESSSLDDDDKVQKIIVKDNSSDSSEEQAEKHKIVKDATNENMEDEEVTDDDFILTRARRAVISAPHTNNHLLAKDEKYLKQKRLRFLLESSLQDIHDRNKRSADTSEENSSEEVAKDKSQAKDVAIAKKPEAAPAETLQLADKSGTTPAEKDLKTENSRRKRNTAGANSSEEDNSSEEGKQEIPAKGVVIAKKPETAPAESEPKSAALLRRRRSVADFSEEDQSQQAQDENEVYILSNEKQTNNDEYEINEPVVLSDKHFEAPAESSLENKNSEEDYAQGCGGNRSDNSNETSNETL